MYIAPVSIQEVCAYAIHIYRTLVLRWLGILLFATSETWFYVHVLVAFITVLSIPPLPSCIAVLSTIR